jgi:hypothetical protein
MNKILVSLLVNTVYNKWPRNIKATLPYIQRRITIHDYIQLGIVDEFEE